MTFAYISPAKATCIC